MRNTPVLVALIAVLLLVGCGGERKPEAKDEPKVPAMPETFDAKRLATIGPEACIECHADAVEAWKGSHHAHANRPVNRRQDLTAFRPPRVVEEPGVDYTLTQQGDSFVMKETFEGQTRTYPLVGVIAYDPLRQYLAPFPNGSYQTTSVAYDPKAREWFEVFEGDERFPGEWGHWAGQGMNWNANCAYCHTTDYKKNFELASQSYHSTWLQQGIACAQCHEGLEDHIREARLPDYKPGKLALNEAAVMASCASCHSRREQLTPDTFKPGDSYEDHFGLSLPEHPGLYYPDGQIRDEVFVYGSFMMSRMGHAGVTCMDCHEPHSGATILPAANNSLCMRCHSVGLDNAPIIKETAHSHHLAGSTGNQCISCHMPETPYMQRDPRRDHGFLHPDPLMTQELGIPNACNSCHGEESVEWAVQHAEAWYGEKLAASPQRARARALSAAFEGQPGAVEQLLSLADKEDIAAWRATYTGVLGNYLGSPGVIEYLRERMEDESPWVRARAVSGLTPVPDAGDLLLDKLSDPVRQVRIQAARALTARRQSIPDGQAAEDWNAYLNFNADRPQDVLILAQEAIDNRDFETARRNIQFALTLDQRNAELLRRCAVLYSMMGDRSAAKSSLNQALEIEPENPDVLYSLALLYAEEGDFEMAAAFLEDVVMYIPDFYRAWYNLALAYTKLGRWEAAATALEEAEPAMGNDPNFIRTRLIVERNLQP